MTTFNAALALPYAQSVLYVEIEGLPYAYGTAAKSGAWFDVAGQAFSGVLPWFAIDGATRQPRLPELSGQDIDHVEGRVGVGTMRVEIVDVDGSLHGYAGNRRTDGRIRVNQAADVARADTSFTVGPDLSTAGTVGAWPASGSLWCDKEAMTFTRASNVLTVARGLYRSQASTHIGTLAAGGSPRVGAIVTQYPRSLVGRRVWLKWGLNAASDADTVTAWAGVIGSHGWDNAGSTLVLACEDMQFLAKRPIFRKIRETFAPDTIRNVDPLVDLTHNNSSSGIYRTFFKLRDSVIVGSRFSCVIPGGAFVFEVTEKGSTGGGLVVTVPPGGWRAKIVETIARSVGEVPLSGRPHLLPVIVVGPPAGSEAHVDDKWTAGNHALAVALQILLSTGDGTNYTSDDAADYALANGTSAATGYDTLPASWGLAIPRADVDVAAFEALIRETPSFQITTLILDVVKDAREWMIAQCLKPFGYYLKVGWGGLISVGKIRVLGPTEIAAATALSTADLATRADGSPVNFSGPVSESRLIAGLIKWRDSPVLRTEGLEVTFEHEAPPVTIGVLAEDAYLDMFLAAKTVEVESFGLHRYAPERRIEGSGVTGDEAQLALQAAYKSRFAEPPNVLTIDVWMKAGIRVEVGGLVALTMAHLPNAAATARGAAATVWECWGKRPNIDAGTVTLTLAQTFAATQPVRFLAPAAIVTAYDAGTKTLTLSANVFTRPGGAHSDASAFENLDRVRLYRADLGTRFEAVTIDDDIDENATTIVLSATPAGYTFAAGDVLMMADYAGDSQVARVTSKYAFRAGNDGLLGTADAPHVYA